LNNLEDAERLLYIDLLGKADDDGIVDALTVVRLVQAKILTFRSLCDKKMVIPLNADLVSYIPAWLDHSRLRSDRKIDSRYLPLLFKILPDVKIQKSTQRADRKPKQKIVQEELLLLEGDSNDVGRPMDALKQKQLQSQKQLQQQQAGRPKTGGTPLSDEVLLSEFEKSGVPASSMKMFLDKFSPELVLKELKNLQLQNVEIVNSTAWLFAACKNNYEINDSKIVQQSKRKLIDSGSTVVEPLPLESAKLVKEVEAMTKAGVILQNSWLYEKAAKYM
jgi:hypothetical protein